jgi:hypothetical protein
MQKLIANLSHKWSNERARDVAQSGEVSALYGPWVQSPARKKKNLEISKSFRYGQMNKWKYLQLEPKQLSLVWKYSH